MLQFLFLHRYRAHSLNLVSVLDANGCSQVQSGNAVVTVNELPATTGNSMIYGSNGSSLTASTTIPCGPMNWYKDNGDGTWTQVGVGTSFNPVSSPNSGVTRFTAPGTYTFWAACANAPDCRTAAEFVIEKAEQVITWNPTTPITYGTLLGNAQLNAMATGVTGGAPAGALTYTPAEGTLLDAGIHTLHVDAAETDYYNAASMDVQITVNPKAITVTPDAGQTKVYGSADPTPFTYTLVPGLEGTDIISGLMARASGEDVGSYAFNHGTLTAGPTILINGIGSS